MKKSRNVETHGIRSESRRTSHTNATLSAVGGISRTTHKPRTAGELSCMLTAAMKTLSVNAVVPEIKSGSDVLEERPPLVKLKFHHKDCE